MSETNNWTSFETERLRVSRVQDWFWQDKTGLLQAVLGILTAKASLGLPDDWQGIDNEEKAESWLTELLNHSELSLVSLKEVAETGETEEKGESKQSIGLLVLHRDDPAYQVWQLGYVFAESHWGKGYATELLQGLILNLANVSLSERPHALLAGVEADNLASIRVLEKCDFHRLDKHHSGSTLFYEFVPAT